MQKSFCNLPVHSAIEYSKQQVQRMEIIHRKFYAEAYRDTPNPSGELRLYRVTRALSLPPKSEFAYQSVRIKNPEVLAKVRPVLDYLSGRLGWEKRVKERKAVN